MVPRKINDNEHTRRVKPADCIVCISSSVTFHILNPAKTKCAIIQIQMIK